MCFNLENPSELFSLCSSIAYEPDVTEGMICSTLQSIIHAIDARLPLLKRVVEAFNEAVIGDDDIEADVAVVKTLLDLRLLAMVLVGRLDGAVQVRYAFIFQSVDERVEPYAEALLMLDLDDEILRYHDLESWDLDHSRWWGKFFSYEWRELGRQVECMLDDLSDDHAVARMVETGASEVKARWCLELAEEALCWRYEQWRSSGAPAREELFACDYEWRPKAVWIERGGRPLEHAVRALAERMAKTSTPTLKRFVGFLGSRWTPSVGVPDGL